MSAVVKVIIRAYILNYDVEVGGVRQVAELAKHIGFVHNN